MLKPVFAALIIVLVAPALAVAADDMTTHTLSFGGDNYSAGRDVAVSSPTRHDVFAAGYDVGVSAPVSGSAHLAGYNVHLDAPVSGDLYGAGYSVTVSGAVAGALSAIGNIIHVGAPVTGNARVAGATVTLDSSVGGSVLAAGNSVTLNAPVSGDVSFYGEQLSFGPNAAVAGKLEIHAPQPIEVPASVAPADRVSYVQMARTDYGSEAGKTAFQVVRTWVTAWLAALWVLLLFVVGAIIIASSRRLMPALQTVASRHVWRRIGLGILAFAGVIGLVPAVALTLAVTIVGLLLVPFVAIFVFVACVLAYLTGVYFAGYRVASAMRPVTSTGARILVLAVSLVIAALLNMLPIVGWLINLVIVYYGFGLIAALLMVRWGAEDATRLGGPGEPPPASAATAI